MKLKEIILLNKTCSPYDKQPSQPYNLLSVFITVF